MPLTENGFIESGFPCGHRREGGTFVGVLYYCFIITQRGQPVAELRPVEAPEACRRGWGDMKGKIRIADDFCEPIEEMREYME